MEAELRIAAELSQRPRELITIHQLAKLVGKSYSFTYNAVQRMAKAGMIAQQTVGHATLCALALTHPKVQALLTVIAADALDVTLQQKLGHSAAAWKIGDKRFCCGPAAQLAALRKRVPQTVVLSVESAEQWVKEIDFLKLEIQANAAYFWAVVGEAHG